MLKVDVFSFQSLYLQLGCPVVIIWSFSSAQRSWTRFMMDVPEETLTQMRSIKSAIDELEQHMQPFLDAAPKQINTQLTPLERVKVHLALAQSVVVLYQLHQKLSAAKMDNHPLQKELERLAAYEKKVRKAVTADDLARSRPGISLNIAAANRFIDAAIPDLSADQKQALRSLGKRSREQQDGDAAAAGEAEGNGEQVIQDGQQQQVKHRVDRDNKRSSKRGHETRKDSSSSRRATAAADGDLSDSDSDKQQQQCLGVQGTLAGAAAAAAAEAAELLNDIMAEAGGGDGA